MKALEMDIIFLIRALRCAIVSITFFNPLYSLAEISGNRYKSSGQTVNTYSVPTRVPRQAPRMARVRIHLKLIPYDKIVVRDKQGQFKEKFRPIKKLNHVLRARIERPNHFYVGDWHIETVPMKWDQNLKKLKVKLRFYKRYGEGRNLEEYLGNAILSGTLVGKDFLYVVKGRKNALFKNRKNNPVLAVEIGKAEAPKVGKSSTPRKKRGG